MREPLGADGRQAAKGRNGRHTLFVWLERPLADCRVGGVINSPLPRFLRQALQRVFLRCAAI